MTEVFLPARPDDGHKGTFGTALVVGGSTSSQHPMFGAPVLAGRAALRVGLGKLVLSVPEPFMLTALGSCLSAVGAPLPADAKGTIDEQEAVQRFDTSALGCQAVLLGPGWGQSPSEKPIREALLWRALTQDQIPVVLDADALNTLCSIPDPIPDIRAPFVITPHVGEFRRLASAFRIQPDPVQDPSSAAADLARTLGCVVVLKSHRTVVSDGMDTWRCDSGHPCLATAGTGDVLAGTITGLIAQHVKLGFKPAPDDFTLSHAGRAGVEIHARAGQRWAKAANASAGLLAEELVDYLPAAAEAIRQS